MATICKGKDSWPELLGVDGAVAAATIEKENPLVTAIIVLEGTGVPEDFRCTRVWVWVNTNNIVTSVPTIGKLYWPELLGVDGGKAAAIIEEENDLVTAVIVPEDAFVTQDFRCNRVWVWVDENNIVRYVPKVD